MVAAAAALLAAAWWVVGLRPFSGAATATVLAAGVAAMAWGARSPPRPRDQPAVDRRAATGWLLVAGAAAVWELAAFFQRPREDHPTISSLTNTLLDSRPARAGAFVAWLVAAAALARR